MSSTRVEKGLEERLRLSYTWASAINRRSGKRRSVPIRSAFARDMKGAKGAPMTKLVAIGGRGGEVPLKLYTALIWRSSAAPFTTTTPARIWAELLAIPGPSRHGARRITDAITTLAEHRLIDVKHRRGEPPEVTLLREDGSDQPYSIPRGRLGDIYFHIPAEMWLTGKLQQLSAPGLAMLMAVLADQDSPGAPVWWSTTRFPGRFGLSPATRARGTTELEAAGLLQARRTLVRANPGKSFAADRVRKIYTVTGEALLKPPATSTAMQQATNSEMEELIEQLEESLRPQPAALRRSGDR
jgi:hypothetical protein